MEPLFNARDHAATLRAVREGLRELAGLPDGATVATAAELAAIKAELTSWKHGVPASALPTYSPKLACRRLVESCRRTTPCAASSCKSTKLPGHPCRRDTPLASVISPAPPSAAGPERTSDHGIVVTVAEEQSRMSPTGLPLKSGRRMSYLDARGWLRREGVALGVEPCRGPVRWLEAEERRDFVARLRHA